MFSLLFGDMLSAMAKLVEIDEKVRFSDQIKEDAGPIIFINKEALFLTS